MCKNIPIAYTCVCVIAEAARTRDRKPLLNAAMCLDNNAAMRVDVCANAECGNEC